MLFWILILLVIVGSTAIHNRRSRSRVYVESLVLILILILLSMVLFIALLVALVLLPVSISVSSYFSAILLLVIVVGLIMSMFLSGVQKRFCYSMTMEYYIQWTLIYTTIYQVIFNTASRDRGIQQLLTGTQFIAPDYIIMALFPALISTWIAIVVYKVRKNNI